MKVTETSSNGDIKTVILDLAECKADVVQVYSPSNEPLAFRIIKSGWSKPQKYHVLIEYGDREQTDYDFLDAEQIKEKYGIDLHASETPIIVDLKTIKEFGNSQDLGNSVRSTYLKQNSKFYENYKKDNRDN